MKSKKKWTQDLGNFRHQDIWYFSTAICRILNSTTLHPTLGSFCFTGEPQRSLLHLVPHYVLESHPPFSGVTHLSVLSWPLGPSFFLQTDVRPSFIYSWSIRHILEHEFFCLVCSGSYGRKKMSISEQVLRVVLSTFCEQKSSNLKSCIISLTFLVKNRLPLKLKSWV